MKLRQSLLAATTSIFTQLLELAHRRDRSALRIFALCMLVVGASFAFVAVSLPSFFRFSPAESFLRIARTGEDGAILDSYTRHNLYYAAGIGASSIALAVISVVVLGKAALRV